MTTDARPRYDLISEPWLPAVTTDGRVVHLGLRAVVERAGELRCLLGDLPTQAFAQLRLLEAVLLRSVAQAGIAGLSGWRDLWNGKHDLAALVGEHLDRHTDRFDLRHPATPFYQVADLRTGKDGVSPLRTLLADVPNGEQYFSVRSGAGATSLSAAEAARALVHVQAYDPSGIKSGAVGDDRVRGGRGYPIGTAWVGGLGGLYVEGDTLRETLLLNLVLADSNTLPWPAAVSAVWERPSQTAAVRPEGPEPTGPADLLTWQSRRVRLHWEGDRAVGVVVANGDALDRQGDRFRYELLSGWRRSPAQEKALKRPLVYMPLEHRPDRAMWRGLSAILPGTASTTGTGKEPSERRAAPVLDWLALVTERRLLAEDHPLRLHAVGMTYGSQSAVVDDVVDDALPLAAVLLAEQGAELRAGAVDAVSRTEQAARAVGHLADNLAVAAGGAGDGASGAADRARERAYFAVDAPFRSWLRDLGARGTEGWQGALGRWEATARELLQRLGRELLDTAGEPAWVGRDARRRPDDPARWVDSSLAWAWFLRALDAALPTTVTARDTTPPAARPTTEEDGAA